MISHGYGSFYSFDTFDNGNFKDFNTKTLFIGWKAATAQAVPEGYVVVPAVPTEELLSKAILKYLEVSDLSIITSRMAHLYDLIINEAMIQATQEPSE